MTGSAAQQLVGSTGEVVLYEAPDGTVTLDVRLSQDTVWLTQQQMADLFGRERSVVTKHIRNVFKDGELGVTATSAKFAQVQAEGDRTKLGRTINPNVMTLAEWRRKRKQTGFVSRVACQPRHFVVGSDDNLA